MSTWMMIDDALSITSNSNTELTSDHRSNNANASALISLKPERKSAFHKRWSCLATAVLTRVDITAVVATGNNAAEELYLNM